LKNERVVGEVAVGTSRKGKMRVKSVRGGHFFLLKCP